MAGGVESIRVKLSQIESSRVKLSQVESSQVELSQVNLGQAGYILGHIGPCPSMKVIIHKPESVN